LLAIIRNVGAGWPVWFHLDAIVLHLAATLLVWRMLARGVRRWPAALAALWFAVHPVHVEAVANISNSADAFVALWTLGVSFVLAAFAESVVPWRRALLAAILFFLAMLTKETGSMSLGIALVAAVAWRPSRGAALDSVNGATQQPSFMALGLRWYRLAIA